MSVYMTTPAQRSYSSYALSLAALHRPLQRGAARRPRTHRVRCPRCPRPQQRYRFYRVLVVSVNSQRPS